LHLKKLTCLTSTVLAVGGTAVFASAAQAASPTLNGAGSTLVAPLEAEWAQAFSTVTGGDQVNYQAVGSGTGIKDISSGTVDFGASDAPLSPTQQAGCANCIQIPWALSATGVGWHIDGIRTRPGHGPFLNLTGSVLVKIYEGRITNWDNPAIARLNKGETLPNLKITAIYRTDGSGDTYAFTNYLSDVSSGWARSVGYGTSVQFPTGTGGAHNTGVTGLLQTTNGSIAYIAVSYLISHGLPAAAIKNAAGRFEYPNLNEIENAAGIVKHVPANNAIPIVDPPRKAKIAYPISTFTYVIVPTTAPQGALLRQWIDFALSGTGQSFGPALDFARLPKVVKNAALASVNKIQ
jgi:phosphate transport system substrate-binding protein